MISSSAKPTHMKKLHTVLAVAFLTACFMSCKKDSSEPAQDGISQETLAKIKSLGFGTSSVQKHEDGYLVEGDIILTEDFLNSSPAGIVLRVGEEEQYHTTNLVSVNGSRLITVSLSSRLPSSYGPALDEAINRYNAENLTIDMQRVSSGADIAVVPGNGNYLASAGFPSSTGEPYGQVKINARYLGSGNGSTTFTNYIATIISHEIGHCVGFRHTDYMDRSYSCGGSYSNEGASTVGAIHIPGTPTGPDAKSFMLSCISKNENRPFNANDRTALDYLY